jgi:parallel beta-helix repeat protein
MRRSMVLPALLVFSALGAPAAGAGASGARDVIEVFPGPNAINRALRAAQPGDVLNIHAGTYAEQVTVTTSSVVLQAAGDGKVVIDGECEVSVTLDVAAEGVTLRGLTVRGAGIGLTPISIDFSHVDSGRVEDSTAIDTCGDAWYGVNVYNGGSIQIIRNRTLGFDDAGIYVGGITSTPLGPLLVSQNHSYVNEQGVIVQNSGGGDIVVAGNRIFDNGTTGIWLNGADGVRIERNDVISNSISGIELDESSDDNLINGNTALEHPFDLVDQGGSNNCWMRNRYVTSQGDISC